MNKKLFLLTVICIILILNVAAVWLIDAMVQIDDDYGVLCAFLLVLNVILVSAARVGYKKFNQN